MKYSARNVFGRPLLGTALLLSFTIGASTSRAADIIVNGSNTFSGTINSGDTLQLLDTATLSGAVINNGLLDFRRTAGQNYSTSEIISGSGNVSVSTAFTLTLTGANTYTGTTTFANLAGTAGSPPLLKLSNSTGPAIQGNLVVGNNTSGIAAVTMTHSNQFGANSVISFNSTAGNWGYFNMNADQTVAGLSSNTGGGVIQVNQFEDAASYGARTLTVNVATGNSFTHSGYIRDKDGGSSSSTLGITKTGAGTQIISEEISYTGATTVSAGTLGLTGATGISNFKSNSVSIASGAMFKLDATGAGPGLGAGDEFRANAQFGQNATTATPLTLSGAGTFQVTGGATDLLALGNTESSANGSVRINLSSGGLLHVQSGILRNGGYNATDWTTNQGGLQVDSGATFQLWDANNTVRVDALTGAGTIGNGLFNSVNAGLVVGVANGSGTFSGTITNGLDGSVTGATAAFMKLGTGTQTLSGTNSYTGATTAGAGILQFSKTSALYNSGTAAAWSETNFIVEGGATAAFNVGGNGEFTSANIDTLKGLGSATGGFKTGATLGLDTSSGNFSYSSSIANPNGGSNVLGLAKLGSNTLTLTGTNTYSGLTTVAEGSLIVNGTNSGAVTVASGGTIGGSGTVGALTVQAGGIIAPGNSPGIFNTGDYNQAGTLSLELIGTIAGTEYDQVNVTGSVVLSGDLSATVGYTPVNEQLLFILLNDGTDAISGTFTGFAQDDRITLDGFEWLISYEGNYTGSDTGTFLGGNDVVLMAIPEPHTLLLSLLGLIPLLRRKRK